MTDTDFTARMSHVPDEELIAVISSDGFRPEAIAAARAELERRNVSPDSLARMNADAERRQRAEENRPFVPLGTAGKIYFFLFWPLFLVSIASVVILRTRGYRRKSEDALKWMAIGFGFSFFVGLVLDFVIR